MSIGEQLSMELSHEGSNTRKLLERVPEEQFGWKPHEKSMTMGRLASHIAENPEWTDQIIRQKEMNMNTGDYKPWTAASRAELLKRLDSGLKMADEALRGAKDSEMQETWSFKMDGKAVFSMPRAAVMRVMILSHSIHHRGQFEVYLRMHNVPLPAIYGPSADDSGGM